MCALFPCPLLQFPPCIISSDVAHPPPPPQCPRGHSFQPLTDAHALLYSKITAFVQDVMPLGTPVPGWTQGPFSIPQSMDCHSYNSLPPSPVPARHTTISLFFPTVVINWFFYIISVEFGSRAFLPHNWHSHCRSALASGHLQKCVKVGVK